MYPYVHMDETIFITHLNMTLGIMFFDTGCNKICMETQNTTDIQSNPNQKQYCHGFSNNHH